MSSQTSSAMSGLPRPSTPIPLVTSLRRDWAKWLELFSVIAAIEAVLWTEGRARFVVYLLANVWVVYVALRQRRSAQELGITRKGLSPSAWIIPAGAAMALTILAMGLGYGTLHILFGIIPIALHVGAYALWALVQQFVAQSFFFLQIESLTGDSRAASIGAGLIFGFFHLPNPVLLIVTTIGGLVFSEMFCRYRNIYPLAFAHAAVALAIAVSLPDDVHRHMRVGIGYINYKQAERPSVPIAPASQGRTLPRPPLE